MPLEKVRFLHLSPGVLRSGVWVFSKPFSKPPLKALPEALECAGRWCFSIKRLWQCEQVATQVRSTKRALPEGKGKAPSMSSGLLDEAQDPPLEDGDPLLKLCSNEAGPFVGLTTLL